RARARCPSGRTTPRFFSRGTAPSKTAAPAASSIRNRPFRTRTRFCGPFPQTPKTRPKRSRPRRAPKARGTVPARPRRALRKPAQSRECSVKRPNPSNVFSAHHEHFQTVEDFGFLVILGESDVLGRMGGVALSSAAQECEHAFAQRFGRIVARKAL